MKRISPLAIALMLMWEFTTPTFGRIFRGTPVQNVAPATCPQGIGDPNDGCQQALTTGTTLGRTAFYGTVSGGATGGGLATGSGQTYPVGSLPVFNIAGVDYPVGADTTAKTPISYLITNHLLPSQCSSSSGGPNGFNHIVCTTNGSAWSLSNIDFSQAANGQCWSIRVNGTGTGFFTITDDNFADDGPGCDTNSGNFISIALNVVAGHNISNNNFNGLTSGHNMATAWSDTNGCSIVSTTMTCGAPASGMIYQYTEVTGAGIIGHPTVQAWGTTDPQTGLPSTGTGGAGTYVLGYSQPSPISSESMSGLQALAFDAISDDSASNTVYEEYNYVHNLSGVFDKHVTGSSHRWVEYNLLVDFSDVPNYNQNCNTATDSTKCVVTGGPPYFEHGAMYPIQTSGGTYINFAKVTDVHYRYNVCVYSNGHYETGTTCVSVLGTSPNGYTEYDNSDIINNTLVANTGPAGQYNCGTATCPSTSSLIELLHLGLVNGLTISGNMLDCTGVVSGCLTNLGDGSSIKGTITNYTLNVTSINDNIYPGTYISIGSNIYGIVQGYGTIDPNTGLASTGTGQNGTYVLSQGGWAVNPIPSPYALTVNTPMQGTFTFASNIILTKSPGSNQCNLSSDISVAALQWAGGTGFTCHS